MHWIKIIWQNEAKNMGKSIQLWKNFKFVLSHWSTKTYYQLVLYIFLCHSLLVLEC